MSSKTLEGMARCFEIASDNGTYDIEAMRGAVLWLSKNVSDEMVFASIALPNDPRRDDLIAAFASPRHKDTIERTRACISRALRAAAEGSE